MNCVHVNLPILEHCSKYDLDYADREDEDVVYLKDPGDDAPETKSPDRSLGISTVHGAVLFDSRFLETVLEARSDIVGKFCSGLDIIANKLDILIIFPLQVNRQNKLQRLSLELFFLEITFHESQI